MPGEWTLYADPAGYPPQVPAPAYHRVLGSQATEESPSPAKHLVPLDTCAEILANEKQRHVFPGQTTPRKAFSSQRGPETGHLRGLGVNDYMKVQTPVTLLESWGQAVLEKSQENQREAGPAWGYRAANHPPDFMLWEITNILVFFLVLSAVSSWKAPKWHI